ncbi:MAG: hypothetical protein VKL00_12900 [Synechococcales bacterium]|nr:hypothetical protein [Synechococcales bacterium]
MSSKLLPWYKRDDPSLDSHTISGWVVTSLWWTFCPRGTCGVIIIIVWIWFGRTILLG